MRNIVSGLIACVVFFISCSSVKQIGRSANENVLKDPALQTAHVGISIYNPATNKYVYNYQGDKYFVPASNTKIPTCYAAMKYLGDSLVAARLAIDEEDSAVLIYPSGDPTFLHADYTFQPLFEAVRRFPVLRLNFSSWKSQRWGSGWSWNDYDEAYMAERSAFPVYGNVIKFKLAGDTLQTFLKEPTFWFSQPDTFNYEKETHIIHSKYFTLERAIDDNRYYVKPSKGLFKAAEIPFRADFEFVSKLLEDTIGSQYVSLAGASKEYVYNPAKRILYSQPTDSLLKPLMHRSDNFFAEQVLLMVSNEVLGEMNDAKIIDTILKSDFKDLPHKPRWVDGSGLSRYNLFTPQDMVAILNKMQAEFGMERIKEIFPTGNDGTLTNYYKKESGYIFAKTGTLSGVVALSGFLYTQKNQLLIFSVLVNNHQASATAVRRAVEKFIESIREQY